MHRRDLLKAGIQGAVAVGGLSRARETGAAENLAAATRAAPILATYTAEEHRRRLQNIAFCNRAIQRCMRKHLITSYMPGQCCYNLGEYPSRKPWEIGEYDEQELDRLKKHGIELIQVFDEWNDSLRLFGGDKFTSVNPAAFRRFIKMVHDRGMKIIAYMSTCFFERNNPACRPEWYRENDYLRLGYWNMARCSPASPGWRATLLPHLPRILDEFGLDGVYVDGGYVQNYRKQITTPAKDEVPAFEETPQYDGAFTDLLALMYAEVKRRGGIFKLHVDAADQPRTGGMKVYDYLWVGEGVGNADALREATKDYPPYVVPCIDMTFAKVASENEPFFHAIPYMQFPVLQAGRPFTGERGMVPGVDYPPEDQDFWVRRCKEAWKHHQAHPNGPYTYGGWDAVPQSPETRPTHARWLAQYQPMVEEGTWAWLEIAESSLFVRPLPKDVVASAFANRQMYLVLANYGQTAVEVETTETFVPVASPAAVVRKHALPPRSLAILRRGE